MKKLFTLLLTVLILLSCANDNEGGPSILGPPTNVDLHPAENIRIVRTSDGLERKIGIFREEWLGDRYSDPVFLCEASSIDRLIKFLSNAVNDIEISGVKGSMLIPPGTYIYEFEKRPGVLKLRYLTQY